MCGHLIGGVAEVAWHRMVWSLPNRKVIRFFPICVACRHGVRFVLALAITRGGATLQKLFPLPTAIWPVEAL